MRSLPLLLLLAACSPKVPSHLAIDPPKPHVAEVDQVRSLEAAIQSMVQKDPLARAPTLPEAERLDGIEGGAPLAAYVRLVRSLERGDGQVERELQQLEDEWTGTAVVALSRGYRLRLVENLLATTPELNDADEVRVAVLLTPLQSAAVVDTLPRGPLAWIDGPDPLNERVRRIGDRWVLAGWLDSPDIPLEAVGRSLDSPIYDGLTQTPLGKLVVARASGADAAPGRGYEDLTEATRLALIRAAADRDKEQAAWSTERLAAIEAVGGGDDPIATLLHRSAEALTPAAKDPGATAGALVALAALRWNDSCSDAPCIGLDRTQWMRTAEKWSPEVAPLAAAWRVVALKEALDDMDVGHQTVLFPKATTALADALLGTGAGPLDLSLLRRQTPTPQVWLELARAVGSEGATDWSETRVAIGTHLERQARFALEMQQPDALREPLERIAKRAVP